MSPSRVDMGSHSKPSWSSSISITSSIAQVRDSNHFKVAKDVQFPFEAASWYAKLPSTVFVSFSNLATCSSLPAFDINSCRSSVLPRRHASISCSDGEAP